MALVKMTLGGLSYKDIPMIAAEGVHEEVQRLIEKHIQEKDRGTMTALDLAAGNGALSQRLKDLGFQSVVAWELEPENFRAKGVEVLPVDLNKPFPRGEAFDLITATEIIEHLENPFHFLREISKSLKPGGMLVLSTPNIESALSRVQFLYSGMFRWFNEASFAEWGHIQPISSFQLDKALRSAGLEIVEQGHNSHDRLLTIDRGLKNYLKALSALLLYPLMKGHKRGDINLWLIRHSPKPARRG
jgi:SAM-dependent methyltransferase